MSAHEDPPAWLPASSSGDLRQRWEALLDRARDWPVPLHLYRRCDEPTLARLALVELRPDGRGAVLIRSCLVATSPRLRQRLFDPGAERDGRMLRVCAWCNRFELAGGWVPVELAVERLGLPHSRTVPRVTPGICDRCAEYLEDPSPDLAPDPPL
jgi:hypothetical protein